MALLILIAESLFRIKNQTIGLNSFNKPKGQWKMDYPAIWARFHKQQRQKNTAQKLKNKNSTT